MKKTLQNLFRNFYPRRGRPDSKEFLRQKLESLYLEPGQNTRTSAMSSLAGPDGGTGEATFQFQDGLRSLPVPSLDQTLAKYLDSVRPHVTEAELQATEAIAERFRTGIGQQLQEKLLEIGRRQRNWVERFWEPYAYLDLRVPILPFVNFGGPGPLVNSVWPAEGGTQLERAALFVWMRTRHWLRMRRQEVKPTRAGTDVWCMNQFRSWSNACRLPGVVRDSIVRHFKTESEGDCDSHLVVMCRGRIYRLPTLDDAGEPFTPPEFQRQLEAIAADTERRGPGPGLGILTCDERTSWAQNRDHLIALGNREQLRMIEISQAALVLDDAEPSNDDEVMRQTVQGRHGTDRWADKGNSDIVFSSGTLGTSCEHSMCDAMVLVETNAYIERDVHDIGGRWQGSTAVRQMEKPKELVFNIDDKIRDAVVSTQQFYAHNIASIEGIMVWFTDFGSSALKNLKDSVHVDLFIQLAIQLAYYRLYKRPAATYETATTRKFYHGRTETVRSCTVEGIEWCRSMLDGATTPFETKLSLLRRAREKQAKLMREAMNGEGCDRHLFGLYCLAMEEGLPIPQLYTDPSWSKSGGGGNFTLSTSWVGYTTVSGGVCPMCSNGYGCFYRTNEEKFVFYISRFTADADTSCSQFYDSLKRAMRDQLDLWQAASAEGVTAKL